MELIMKKWHPESPECVFQHYFYQDVGKERAMYYTPEPHEDAKKWEEALEHKPSEGSIPVLARGFGDLGIAARLRTQQQAVEQLNVRVHEINDSLKVRIEEHDLKFTVRTQEARRKHLALSRRCLALATKVQVLRNRGYALDSAEEDLKNKLSKLEETAFDPVLSGRQEEIWARMTVVRERAQMLKEETDKLGKKVGTAEQEPLDEENMAKVKKVNSNISQSQISTGLTPDRSWKTTTHSLHIFARNSTESRMTLATGNPQRNLPPKTALQEGSTIYMLHTLTHLIGISRRCQRKGHLDAHINYCLWASKSGLDIIGTIVRGNLELFKVAHVKSVVYLKPFPSFILQSQHSVVHMECEDAECDCHCDTSLSIFS
jgi:hypothetical protein